MIYGLLFGKSLSQLEALEVLEQGEELRSFTSRNIVWLNQIIVKEITATVHGNVSVWRAKMKVAAMKLASSEIRSQICRSHVKILVKWFT